MQAPAIGDAASQYGNDLRGNQHAVIRRNGRLRLRRTVIAGGIAAAAVFALIAGHIVGDRSAAQPVSADGKVGYVTRVGSDAQVLTTSSVDVPVLHATSADQTLIVSITLSSTSAGNSYSVIGDIVDDYRHRTMLFAVFDAKPLSTSDQISAHYPPSSKYHIAIDAFRGISSAGLQAGSASLYGHNTEFTTSATMLPCGPGDLLLTTIATNSGTAPSLVEGWHTLPELKLSSYRQITGFRFIEAPGKCSATGTTTAQWEVVAVILHR